MIKKSELILEKKQLILKKLVHQLACNNPAIRLRTIKQIKLFLTRISNNIQELELIQLWKGLHYAMWMTDKLLNQEALSEEISNLLFSFRQSKLVLQFFDAYLNLQVHEWLLIDQLRLDKFMMLVRMMFDKMFKHLNDESWDFKSVSIFNDMMYKYLMLEGIPNSFLFHIIQIFLPELEKQQFTIEMLTSSIRMFAKVFSKTNKKYLAIEIKKHILMNILLPDSKFQVDNEKLSEFLLKLVNKKSCKNQILVLGYIKLLKNCSIQLGKTKDKAEQQSRLKKSKKKIDDNIISDDVIEDAVKRWRKLEAKLHKKYLTQNKKRKKSDDQNYNNIDDDSDEIEEDIMIDEENDDNEVACNDDSDDDDYDDIEQNVLVNDENTDIYNDDKGYNKDKDVTKNACFNDAMDVEDDVIDDEKLLEFTKDLNEKTIGLKVKQNKNKEDCSLHLNLPHQNDVFQNMPINGMSEVNGTHTRALVVKDNNTLLKKIKKKKILKKKKVPTATLR